MLSGNLNNIQDSIDEQFQSKLQLPYRNFNVSRRIQQKNIFSFANQISNFSTDSSNLTRNGFPPQTTAMWICVRRRTTTPKRISFGLICRWMIVTVMLCMAVLELKLSVEWIWCVHAWSENKVQVSFFKTFFYLFYTKLMSVISWYIRDFFFKMELKVGLNLLARQFIFSSYFLRFQVTRFYNIAKFSVWVCVRESVCLCVCWWC